MSPPALSLPLCSVPLPVPSPAGTESTASRHAECTLWPCVSCLGCRERWETVTGGPARELSPEWAGFPEEERAPCSTATRSTLSRLSRKPGCDGLHLGFGAKAFDETPADREGFARKLAPSSLGKGGAGRRGPPRLGQGPPCSSSQSPVCRCERADEYIRALVFLLNFRSSP